MRRIVPGAAALACLVLAVLFQWNAQGQRSRMEGYQNQATLLLQEPRGDRDAAQLLESWQEEGELVLWGEAGQQSFAGAQGHEAALTAIAFSGSTQLLFPGGPVLRDTDREGCLVDLTAAWELFGSGKVQGETVSQEGRCWVVRGVLPSREGLVVLPAGEGTEEIPLDCLTAELGSRGRQQAAELLAQGGFAGSLLRMDFYQGLSWIKELVPGKWSDFEGWGRNLEKKAQEWRLLTNSRKKIPQLLQYLACRSYYGYQGGSAVCLLGFLLLLHLALGPSLGKILPIKGRRRTQGGNMEKT